MLCFSTHPKGLLEVTLLLHNVSVDRLHSCTDKKWKCSTKVKYRCEWECRACCGGTLEEVVMMTALTQCRCSKAWQVGQLPRTHYFSPETNLVMCKVLFVKDWPIVNSQISQVLHKDAAVAQRLHRQVESRRAAVCKHSETPTIKPVELVGTSVVWPIRILIDPDSQSF